MVGGGTPGRCGEESGETRQRGDAQPGVRAFIVPKRPRAAESAESKAASREGRQEGGCVKAGEGQSGGKVPVVSERTTQATEARQRDWSWVEASIWTERMLAALENGVKGGTWFSLIDKVSRPETLWAAWRKVARNAGAAGVDGQSVAQFL